MAQAGAMLGQRDGRSATTYCPLCVGRSPSSAACFALLRVAEPAFALEVIDHALGVDPHHLIAGAGHGGPPAREAGHATKMRAIRSGRRQLEGAVACLRPDARLVAPIRRMNVCAASAELKRSLSPKAETDNRVCRVAARLRRWTSARARSATFRSATRTKGRSLSTDLNGTDLQRRPS